MASRTTFGTRLGALALCLAAVVGTSAHGQNRTVNSWFSDKSIWNIPLGNGALFEDESTPTNKMLHDENVGGHSKSYAWIGGNLVGVFQQGKNDPVARWRYEARSATGIWLEKGPLRNGSFKMKTPKNVEFLGGTDQYLILITEDGKYAYEMWKGLYNAQKRRYETRYIALTDLNGTGIPAEMGRSEGIRAFGGSLLGGLILCNELKAGTIRHGIAMLLSPTQMKAGATAEEQLVWPASTTDNAGKNNYSGLIPMGSLIAIPQDVDISKLGLSAEGLALARAYQQYGGYVVDSAANTMMLGVMESGCPAENLEHLQADKRKILKYLRIVSNNSKQHPGGPGQRVVKR